MHSIEIELTDDEFEDLTDKAARKGVTIERWGKAKLLNQKPVPDDPDEDIAFLCGQAEDRRTPYSKTAWRHELAALRNLQAQALMDGRHGREVFQPLVQSAKLAYAEAEKQGQDGTPHPHFRFIGRMLFCYAMEIVTKGTLFRLDFEQNREQLEKGVESDRVDFPRYLITHKLAVLIAKCGIELNQQELQLVELCCRAAVWQGRYPCPTTKEGWIFDLYTLKHPTKGALRLVAYDRDFDEELQMLIDLTNRLIVRHHESVDLLKQKGQIVKYEFLHNLAVVSHRVEDGDYYLIRDDTPEEQAWTPPADGEQED